MTSNVKVMHVQPQHDLLLIRGESHKVLTRRLTLRVVTSMLCECESPHCPSAVSKWEDVRLY